MTNVVLGFVGLAASGKGDATRYLKEHHRATTFRFSTILRNMLDRVYLEQSRDNLIKLSEIMRDTFGEDILAKTMAEDVAKSDNPLIIVDGIRRKADIAHLNKLPHFVLIEITADIHTRYERLVLRGENADDCDKTFEQFQADHERSTEVSILDVATVATERIINNGTQAELYEKIDSLIKKYIKTP